LGNPATIRKMAAGGSSDSSDQIVAGGASDSGMAGAFIPISWKLLKISSRNGRAVHSETGSGIRLRRPSRRKAPTIQSRPRASRARGTSRRHSQTTISPTAASCSTAFAAAPAALAPPSSRQATR
jgi:hypothetical protein